MADKSPPSTRGNVSPAIPTRAEIDAFLTKMKESSGGRLIFALDATASRQPTWDTACQLQADMFSGRRQRSALSASSWSTTRGDDECRASRWVSQAERLGTLMGRINCVGRLYPDRPGAPARPPRE